MIEVFLVLFDLCPACFLTKTPPCSLLAALTPVLTRFRVRRPLPPHNLKPVGANSRDDGLTAKAETKRLGFCRFYRLFWQGLAAWAAAVLSLFFRADGARRPEFSSRIGPFRRFASVVSDL